MSNGGIIGVANIPTTTVASGVWTIDEVLLARSQGIWPELPILVDFLVTAGGGAGGGTRGGGGGAGGYRTSYSTSGGGSAAETKIAVDLAANYTVTIGAGGVGRIVEIAMNTRMENTSVEMIPASSAMPATTISTAPRPFIAAPTVMPSRQPRPLGR